MESKEYLHVIHPERFKKATNAEKWEKLKEYAYNWRQKEFLQRNMESWGKLILFYGVFYILVIFLYIALIGLFALVGDDIYPVREGRGSALQEIPGMALRPVADFESTLIRFTQGKPSTYKPHTDHIQSFLDQYENERQVGENFIDCDQGKDPGLEQKVCRFDINKLGGMCTWQKDYGYDEGQPCIILKLNKLMQWLPDPYTDSEDDGLPDELEGERFRDDHIGVTCEGRFEADVENIGNITYYPPQGFPIYYFPYLNQEGFRSPLVMVRFENPANGVLINVMCKAWAKNITPRHSENDRLGLITFELLVD